MAQLKSWVVAVVIKKNIYIYNNAMHCRLRGEPNSNYASSPLSIEPRVPLQTFAVF